MESKELQLKEELQSSALRAYLRTGDLSQMPEDEKDKILVKMCAHYGLDPILRPFILITLRAEGGQSKQVWYPTKAATDQLACKANLTREITDLGINEQAGIVTCRCKVTDGSRVEESVAAVSIVEFVKEGGQVQRRLMSGEAHANAVMKCETKAKRRASMCWFGLAEADYDTPQAVANVQSLQAVQDLPQIEATIEAEETETEKADKKKKRRTRAEIEAEKMAAPVVEKEDRLHLAEQLKDAQALAPEPTPEPEAAPEPTPATPERTGVIATDKNGQVIGVDSDSPLGIACLRQQWAIENAQKNHGNAVVFYDRTIDLHKEQLKQSLQQLGIQWSDPKQVQIATKISMAANGKAPIMVGLNVLTLEFCKWISGEWDKHKIEDAQKEIPL